MTTAHHSQRIDDLLLPGTPSQIRSQYHTLEERALSADFGLLEQDIIILDTETTGLSFHDCELIQIAAARLSGRQIVERFDTFVHPHGLIPAEIVELTHISNADVASAPQAVDAVRALADFVGGEPVLAHNATFDRAFIERVPGGHTVSDTWIDTLALSRIALPRLRSHRLQDMAYAFGCEAVTHRANDDVEALCGMWRIMLLALGDLPEGLLNFLANMHPDIAWPFRAILGHMALEQDAHTFHLKETRSRLVHKQDIAPHDDAHEVSSFEAVSAEEMRDAFAPGGLVSRMYTNYERRPEQTDMAIEGAAALSTSTHRALEAGTGVGKSIAYLLPEVLFAQRNNVTVGIATKTNALTDQLVSHELPALDQVLPEGLTFTSLKGYEHYPCLLRLERAALGDLPLEVIEKSGISRHTAASEMLTALAVTYAFACQSPEGDLDSLGIRWRYVPRALLTTTSAQCLHGQCPYYPHECFVYGARRRAATADVVVTNHSLLLRDVAAEGRILPPIRHWVIDEAHAFEAEARRQWAHEIAASDIRLSFELLGSTKSGVIHGLLLEVHRLEDPALGIRLLTKLSAAASRAALTISVLFEALTPLARLGRKGEAYDRVVVWLDEHVRSSTAWVSVMEAGKNATRAVEEVCKDTTDATRVLEASSPRLCAELTEATRFVLTLRDDLQLILTGDDVSYVYSLDVPSRRRDQGTEILRAEKLDIGADLAEKWLPDQCSVLFTSATMTVRSSFEHFDHAVGFDRIAGELHQDKQFTSSFDFDHNMAVVLATDVPVPGSPQYLKALEDLLFEIHCAMEGSTLTLFTNRRDMETVFTGLAPRLATHGLDLRCQERGSSPRRLRESFVADKHQSLFALRSFWEGFDASGDTLRCVVIPKLPFASPQDPLVREREVREERSWWRYSLPEAVLTVKQAAGRLIRTRTDTGVLVLADSRLVTKRYGRQFVDSLPSRSVQQLEQDNVGRFIKMWRRSHER